MNQIFAAAALALLATTAPLSTSSQAAEEQATEACIAPPGNIAPGFQVHTGTEVIIAFEPGSDIYRQIYETPEEPWTTPEGSTNVRSIGTILNEWAPEGIHFDDNFARRASSSSVLVYMCLDEGLSLAEAGKKLTDEPGIKHVQPNYRMQWYLTIT